MTGQPDFKGAVREIADRQAWYAIIDAKFGPCRGCGEVTKVTYHHLVSRSLRGSDVPGNIIPLCGSGTTGCHGEYENRGLKWGEVASAIRVSLQPDELQYILDTKGEVFLDRYYPVGNICPTCGRKQRKPVAPKPKEPARPKKRYVISVPADAEDGAEVLDTLIDAARVKTGRPEGTPAYYPLVEGLAVFVRDAEAAE